MGERSSSSKGVFSKAELPLAKSYVYPAGRSRLILLGIALASLVAAPLLVNVLFLNSSFISNGPLTTDHANFENECSSCHVSFASVTNDKCSVCHEKFGDDLGIYTFHAHYVYRSRDFTRAFDREGESKCFGCHAEHLGREALLTSVDDGKCVDCHAYGSFNRDHPQFDFIAQSLPDDANLKFTHIQHMLRVRQQEGLDDVEQVCLECHNPQQDGRHFEAIDFERHCSACHMGGTERTAQFRARDPGVPIIRGEGAEVRVSLGVETLEAIRRRGGLEDQWAQTASPNEFRTSGRLVMKTKVYHKDPWIMHNLKAIRRAIYPSLGLADLLVASPDVQPHDVKLLYEEALETLESQAVALRQSSEPWVPNELRRLNALLRTVRKKLEDHNTVLDESQFLLAETENPALPSEQVQALKGFADRLTAVCQKCHRVSNATIARVQKDQRVLRRAKFDHRAHVLQRRCLDCHNSIPFLSYLDESTSPSADEDHAGIQNLPGIEQCQSCHSSELASNQCSTCHFFHSNKENRSRLLLYVE